MSAPDPKDSTETTDSFSFFKSETQELQMPYSDNEEIELNEADQRSINSIATTIDSDQDCACE
jgi:hypothetical protein